MRPIVNPYRDKERLADLDGGFGSKVKKGVPYLSQRVLLGVVLLILTIVLYYTHHVHYAHLLPKAKSAIRGSSTSFSDSVKDFREDIQTDLSNKKRGSPSVVDARNKDSQTLPTEKFNSLKGSVNEKETFSPALLHKLHEASMHAGAVEDKILALAALSKQNELKAAAEQARRERQREEERLAVEAAQQAEEVRLEREKKQRDAEAEEAKRAAAEHEAAQLLQKEQAVKVEAAMKEAKEKSEKRAAQEAADQQQAQAMAEKRAAQIEADRRAAQLEADALLAKRADEQRQAAVRAQEEETLKAAEAAAAEHPHDADAPIGVLAPPPDDNNNNALPVQDGPIGVLAPPVEDAPVAVGDVAPVGNIDPPQIPPADFSAEPPADNPVPERGQEVGELFTEEADVLEAQNPGHPAIPPEVDQEAHDAVPVVPALPEVPKVDNVHTGNAQPPFSPDTAKQAQDQLQQDQAVPIVALHPPAQPVEVLSAPGLPVNGASADPALPVPAQPTSLPDSNAALAGVPERPMGYDLSPDVLARMASANAAKTSAQQANAAPGSEKIDYCAGNVDPFASTPVDSFDPPAAADFEIVAEWRSAVASMRNRVSKVRYGGEELRALIKNEVKDLQKMRFKLFCMYA